MYTMTMMMMMMMMMIGFVHGDRGGFDDMVRIGGNTIEQVHAAYDDKSSRPFRGGTGDGYDDGDVLSRGSSSSNIEQVHVAFGTDENSMNLAFAVKNASIATTPRVRYREVGDSKWIEQKSIMSVVKGEYTKYYMEITNLKLNTTYETDLNGTRTTTFSSRRDATDEWSPRLVFFGDLGYSNDQLLDYLPEESAVGAVDAIILFGDMVYWANGENENSFMRDLETWSNASIPVHTSPGNGDSGGNFTSYYKTDFHMPESEMYDSLWHSFDIGASHIIGVSTEAFYYQDETVQQNMLNWMREDLIRANENRENVPWIILHYHRPAYSENYGAPLHGDTYAREVLEPLTFEFGVDVVFSGHVHNQERTYPVYNASRVYNDDENDPYRNARAPVYIISGNPSNAESTSVMDFPPQDWSAFRSYAFGYAHLDVVNRTSIHLDIISTQMGGDIVDEVWITKNVTCNFGSRCTIKPQELDFKGEYPRPAATHVYESWHRRSSIDDLPSSQLSVLSDMYDKFEGANWFRQQNWKSSTFLPCSVNTSWYGVSCVKVVDLLLPDLHSDVSGITSLQLPFNNLKGDLNAVNFQPLMNTLQLLDLSDNLLYGIEFPKFKSPTLYTLMIDSNGPPFQIQGALSETIIDDCPELRYLSLQRHNFTGAIPSSIGNMKCSPTKYSDDIPGCYVWLSNNSFSGNVSRNLCNTTFDEFYIENNKFSCPMPCFTAAYASVSPCDATKCLSCANNSLGI